jgi:hypothetical protein
VAYGELSFLIRLGWLTEAESRDRAAVGTAIGRLLEDSASRHRYRGIPSEDGLAEMRAVDRPVS